MAVAAANRSASQGSPDNVKYEYTVIDNRIVVVDLESYTIVKVLD
ncbi:MAG: DUF1236 domain-containing protein [Mesorhizobium sp.]|nr:MULTISPECIES: DUF1236 domain-containing protein [unclassified Mesorhizobium]RUV03790.1 DUF1236 domain-containing protein [Mesorhizobium sp. M1A.F.Ca.IN.020.03.2.1]RUV16583.1 DUF1236 domain-containing protein [Mesorhizobium sp. M1A.F.Ca.IN.022.04.1.1]RUV84758.1 DUF1236 domain-containing protein [Mesorhizobium sp. M1A.F.Ca.IN.020.32.1.1]RUV97974.1 DUF1236 domain-containing protein [Mesorhizobium sp. M1A.F.Ca.IN.022.07.1.1]RUW07136.1 DUF1236 domain-containing protein [Mesorhizobium sp. M1A.F.C